MSLKGNTPEERTWNYLLEKIGNAFGAAGIMGNLKAESGVIFNRVEILCLKRLQENGKGTYTDASYTAAVDSGKISRETFLNPLPGKQYGYGLCQWTSPGRKGSLYDLVKSRGVSIADEQAQLDFMLKELTESYKTVLDSVKSAKTVKAASDIFLTKFEMPADTGNSVKNTRATYGQSFYDKYANSTKTEMKKQDSAAASASASVYNGKYDKYLNSTGTHYISNSGSDEKGGISGGTAGDQTGNEWCLRSWYNRPWDCVLRYEKDTRVGTLLAEIGCAAALNNCIGYDQYQRDTYWQKLVEAGYDPSKITSNCESDCSAGVIANIKAVGHILGISALKNITCTYTGNMKASLKAAGFTVFTGSKYRTSSAYLLPGDVLLNETHHTATNVTRGKSAGTSSGSAQEEAAQTSASVNKFAESKADSPNFNPLYKMTCTGNYVNVRTTPTTKSNNISKYVKQLFKGDVVEYCDRIVANGNIWAFVKIQTKKHPDGYVYDYVCADYLKKS